MGQCVQSFSPSLLPTRKGEDPFYLNEAKCEPYIRSTVEKALEEIKNIEYPNVKEKGIFENEEEYNQIKTRAVNFFSMQISRNTDGRAIVDLDFKDGKTYFLVIEPAGYMHIAFKVVQFREMKTPHRSTLQISPH
jgi:hypothetical protein